MATGFPVNTVVIIIAAMSGTALGAWLTLSETVKQAAFGTQVSRLVRWGVALVLGVWLLIRLVLAVNPPDGAVLGTPYITAFLAFGLLAGIAPLVISPVFRQVVRAVPAHWLVGIHSIRVFGFLFLALMDMKLLPAEFALPAGYGDITVGLLSLWMVYLLTNGKPYARQMVIVWNLLGLLDFVVALITGLAFIGPFVAQAAAAGVSPHYINYVLIVPTFGVPLFAVLHLYSLYQMLARSDLERQNRQEAARTVAA